MGRQLKAETSEDVGLADVQSRSGSGALSPLSTIARAVFVYPGILAAIFIVLVVGGVSGSSIAILSDDARDPGLLFGSPQMIRSDEWAVSTPDFIGQMNSDGKGPRLTGVGEHDLSVLGITPTTDWSFIFRPANVASMAVPPENALAWNWWFPMLVSSLALYGLAWLSGVGLSLSVCVSILISFSPMVEWWHSGSITGPLGFGAAACVFLLMANRAESLTQTLLWSALAFYWVVSFVLILYPPFQVSTLLALIPITIAVTTADVINGRYRWTGVLLTAGSVTMTAAIVFLAFVLSHREAISAITNTVYPGARRSSGGGGSLAQLFSADFSPVLAHGPYMFGGTNLSEIGAPYLLAFESLVVLAFTGWHRTNVTARNVVIATGGSLAVGLAWHQLPVPSAVGRLFLLSFVPPERILPLISISGAFLLAILVHSQTPRLSRRRKVMLGVVIAGTAFGLDSVEAVRLRGLLPALPIIVLVAVAIMSSWAYAALVAAPPRWGTAAVITLVGIGFLSVNPLYRGVGALQDSALAEAIRRQGTEATWVNYGQPIQEAILAASGASSLSGVNYYPNSDAWKELLGGYRDESIWNRFSHTQWLPGDTRAELRLLGNDLVQIRLSPCAPQLTHFGVTHVLAPAGTFNAGDTCLRAIESLSWHGNRYVLYVRAA